MARVCLGNISHLGTKPLNLRISSEARAANPKKKAKAASKAVAQSAESQSDGAA